MPAASAPTSTTPASGLPVLTDSTLLHAYATTRSEESFGTFVRRHLDFVYATALRRIGGDTHHAEEIAQTVFTRVAQKSAALSRHPAINAWLHTATRYAAADFVRREQRRRARELAVHSLDPDMHAPAPDPHTPATADWEKFRPELDTALDQLRETDRTAILLRFFENHTFPAIAEKLHLTEEAARKRTDRALEKLRTHLARRGLTSTAAALTLCLAQNASAATTVPASLASTITTASLAAATPTLLTSALTTLAMTKLQTGTVLTLALAATLGTAFLTTVAARQHATLVSTTTSHAPDTDKTLATLREKIAATEAALAGPRAESQKRAAAKARQLRQDENDIRGPSVLFTERLSAESQLIEFFQEHPLAPATRTALKNILIEESTAQNEYRLRTRREKQEYVFFNPDISEAADKKIHTLLGDDLYHAYREITLGRGTALREYGYDLKDAGVPLTDTQFRTVAHHYYETILRPENPPQLLLLSGLLPQQETFLTRAATTLTPAQLVILRTTLQNENRFSAALRAHRE